jgi:hypothetical protein
VGGLDSRGICRYCEPDGLAKGSESPGVDGEGEGKFRKAVGTVRRALRSVFLLFF